MVEPEFNERQFEQGLNTELQGPVPGSGLIDIPMIPSQNFERYIPFDTFSRFNIWKHIQMNNRPITPVFFQYKVADKMKQSHAKEWDEVQEELDEPESYFRFDVYLGEGQQHNKLVKVAKRWPLTFYASPGFVKQKEYRKYAFNQKLYQNSSFIQAGNLDTVDNSEHVVAYTFPDPKGVVLSEPTRIPVRQGGEAIFRPEEIEESQRLFDEIRQEFTELRMELIDGDYDNDIYVVEGFDSEFVDEWIILQRQFFRYIADIDVHFYHPF
jgi:hypothetical protein